MREIGPCDPDHPIRFTVTVGGERISVWARSQPHAESIAASEMRARIERLRKNPPAPGTRVRVVHEGSGIVTRTDDASVFVEVEDGVEVAAAYEQILVDSEADR